jgi:hypothetical protein
MGGQVEQGISKLISFQNSEFCIRHSKLFCLLPEEVQEEDYFFKKGQEKS